jgi:hypothetical protein
MCNPTNGNKAPDNILKDDKDMAVLTEDPPVLAAGNQIPEWYARRKVNEKSLEDQSNWFSDIFLFYLSPLLRLGAIKLLEDEDIGVPSAEDRAGTTFQKIKEAWTGQLEKAERLNKVRKAKYDSKWSKLSESKKAKMPPFVPSEPGVATALMLAFGVWRILWAIFLYVISAVLGFVPVILLKGTDLRIHITIFYSSTSVEP